MAFIFSIFLNPYPCGQASAAGKGIKPTAISQQIRKDKYPCISIRFTNSTTGKGVPRLHVKIGNTEEKRVHEYLGWPLDKPTPFTDAKSNTYYVYAREKKVVKKEQVTFVNEKITDANGLVKFPLLALKREKKATSLWAVDTHFRYKGCLRVFM